MNRNNNDISSAQLNCCNQEQKLSIQSGKINKYNLDAKYNKDNKSDVGNNSFINDINKYYSVKAINRSFNNLANEENKNLKSNYLNINTDFPNNKNKDKALHLQFNNVNFKTDYHSEKSLADIKKLKTTHYIKKKLFPYKYYLCSIFIKNVDISKRSFFFTKKFTVVYNFICQLFDISSYLILQREFQIMKNTVIEEKQRNIIEKGQKINVNASSFNINMRECLDSKKFSIFGRIKPIK